MCVSVCVCDNSKNNSSEEFNIGKSLIKVKLDFEHLSLILEVCIVVNEEKFQKSHHDLDLGLTMPQIELVQAIFIYYNVFCVFLD